MLRSPIRDDHPACPMLEELSDRQYLPLHPAVHLLLPRFKFCRTNPLDETPFVISVFKEPWSLDQVDYRVGTQRLLKHSHNVVVFRVDGVILFVNDGDREHGDITMIEQEIKETLVDRLRFP